MKVPGKPPTSVEVAAGVWVATGVGVSPGGSRSVGEADADCSEWAGWLAAGVGLFAGTLRLQASMKMKKTVMRLRLRELRFCMLKLLMDAVKRKAGIYFT